MDPMDKRYTILNMYIDPKGLHSLTTLSAHK